MDACVLCGYLQALTGFLEQDALPQVDLGDHLGVVAGQLQRRVVRTQRQGVGPRLLAAPHLVVRQELCLVERPQLPPRFGLLRL